jgi:hypothetical protein
MAAKDMSVASRGSSETGSESAPLFPLEPVVGLMPAHSVDIPLSAADPLGVWGEGCPQRCSVPIPASNCQWASSSQLTKRRTQPTASLSKEEDAFATTITAKSKHVKPEVVQFIERVVVPALVKRYIAQLSASGEQDE